MTSASFLPKRLLLNTIIFHDVQIEDFQVIDTLEEGITINHARRREVFNRELRSAISQENGEGFGVQGGRSGVH